MRLYHRNNCTHIWCIIFGLLAFIISGCSGESASQDLITVTIFADGDRLSININNESTVRDALALAHITLGETDRVEPSLNSLITNGTSISVIRVKEEFYSQQINIPFSHQEIFNEALPQGEYWLSQPGVNGLREITFRRVVEDGKEVSNLIVKSDILNEPIPEIFMIGTKPLSAPLIIPGQFVYLSNGNAWLFEGTTSNRKLLVSTGDLDGRIFSLSENGKYLLFTRNSSEDRTINSLWIARIDINPALLIDLKIKNIVHFAAFDPTSTQVAYSTVEWRETAPGWQANNDLYVMSITEQDELGTIIQLMNSNSGGIYGWWGSDFAWSPDGQKLLYVRPDELGIINIESNVIEPLYQYNPYQATGDWAWVPATVWSPDGQLIYTISQDQSAITDKDNIPQFDLIAISLSNASIIHLQDNVGMFSSISPSILLKDELNTNSTNSGDANQDYYTIAFTQAESPEMSDTSGYRLVHMDRDGSNLETVFPDEGASALEPQKIIWSPEPMKGNASLSMAVVYNGNIWLINPTTGELQQLTGDGLINRIDWR